MSNSHLIQTSVFSDVESENLCVLCNSKNVEIILMRNHKLGGPANLSVPIYSEGVCKTCGLVQHAPMTSSMEYENFYQTFEKNVSNFCLPTELGFHSNSIYKERLAKVIDTLKEFGFESVSASLLEIGSFNGSFLLEAKNYGFEVEGFEPSDYYFKSSESIKNFVHNSFFSENSTIVNQPDIVCISHVLEHVPNPVSFLRDVKKTVSHRAGSAWIMYLEVPNIMKCPRDNLSLFSSFEHTLNFSPETLKFTIGLAGFELIKIEEVEIPTIGPVIRAFCSPSINAPYNPAINWNTSDQIENISQIIQGFTSTLSSLKKILQSEIDKNLNENLIIWGAGVHTYQLFGEGLLDGLRISAIVDSDSSKWGSQICGISVSPPSFLENHEPSQILVSSYSFVEEIRLRIESDFPQHSSIILY
jgi:hypothetical protein